MQLKDSEKREKYKVYGELINAFGYGLTPDDKFLEAASSAGNISFGFAPRGYLRVFSGRLTSGVYVYRCFSQSSKALKPLI